MQHHKPPKFVHPRDVYPNYLTKYWYRFLGIVVMTILLYIGVH